MVGNSLADAVGLTLVNRFGVSVTVVMNCSGNSVVHLNPGIV